MLLCFFFLGGYVLRYEFDSADIIGATSNFKGLLAGFAS